MSDLTNKWCFGEDSENFRGEYDTRDEAIKEGKKEVDEALTVGKMYRPIVSTDVEIIIEDIQENMCDEYGDAADGYLNDITGIQKQELEQEFDKVLDTWIKKYKFQPDFYGVKDIEYIGE